MPRRLVRHILLCLCFVVASASAAHAQLIGDVVHRIVPTVTTETEVAGKQQRVQYAGLAPGMAYDGIALQGVSSDPDLTGWARIQRADGDWTAWQPLYIVRSYTDDAFLAAYRGDEVVPATRFELRFDLSNEATLTLLAAGVFDTRKDEGTPPPDAAEAPDKTTQQYRIVPPDLHPRAEWNAEPFRGTPIPLARPNYTRMTFHHAAGFGATTYQEGLEQVKRIQDFHQNGRGWSDIGYHFVLDESGRVYQGRPFGNETTRFEDGPPLVQGAHVGGANTGNIGVCMLGCYHPPASTSNFPCTDRMSDSMADSAAVMFAFLSERYSVEPSELYGHRDLGSTACPGDNNYNAYIANDRMEDRVEELLVTGNAPLGAATLAATPDDDGVVRLSWEFLEDNGIIGYRIERSYTDTTAVLLEASGVSADAFVDDTIVRPGEVTYRLVATNAAGREQALAVAQTDVPAPDSYALAYNFPNPFSTTTTIRYFLSQEGVATLEVYDQLGRRVATLADGFRDSDRWYVETFDASGLPSGTYYYRLQVEGFAGVAFQETRTFTLLR
ncbi:MAG: T9SS type A sorting domain-containing protein [Bacteroidetes bacterium]|nr:T9SS type A sorting domain-containing protein [Bacteroidota bacterium]